MSGSVSVEAAKARRGGQGMFRVFYGFHAWVGIVLAVVFLAMGVTGSLTVFHDEVDWLLTPALRVTPGETPLPLDEQVAAVAREYGAGAVRSLDAPHGRRWAAVATVSGDGGERQVFVNPYTGAVQGERVGAGPTEAIKRFHTNLWLNYLGGKWGLVGRGLAGLLGLVYVLLSLSGFYIYRARFRGAFRIRTHQGLRAFCADFHKVLGIWTIAFNLTMGGTALVFGVKDGSQLFVGGKEGGRGERVARPEGQRERTGAGGEPGGAAGGRETRKGDGATEGGAAGAAEEFAGGLDAAVSAALVEVPGMEVGRISVPKGAGDAVKISGSAPGAWRLPRRVGADVTTSGTVKVSDSRQGAGAGVINGALKPLHFGRLMDGWGPAAAYGWKALWVTLGLSPGLLSLTGAIMWWRRRGR